MKTQELWMLKVKLAGLLEERVALSKTIGSLSYANVFQSRKYMRLSKKIGELAENIRLLEEIPHKWEV